MAWSNPSKRRWPSIDPGLLRHAVTIQQYAAASPPAFNAAGQVITWSDFCTTFAQIETIKEKDVIRSGQTITETYLVVTVRWQTGIAANMRVVAPNGTYIIQSIENVDSRNVLLKLLCLGLKGNE